MRAPRPERAAAGNRRTRRPLQHQQRTSTRPEQEQSRTQPPSHEPRQKNTNPSRADPPQVKKGKAARANPSTTTQATTTGRVQQSQAARNQTPPKKSAPKMLKGIKRAEAAHPIKHPKPHPAPATPTNKHNPNHRQQAQTIPAAARPTIYRPPKQGKTAPRAFKTVCGLFFSFIYFLFFLSIIFYLI